MANTIIPLRPTPAPREHLSLALMPHGLAVTYTPTELMTALATGGARVLAGHTPLALEYHLPPPATDALLTVVVESWMLTDRTVVEALAASIHHRAHLVPEHLPTLHLALAELISNAVEHGNLGLSSERADSINEMDWFNVYQARVRQALASPLGSLPVILAARMETGRVVVTVEDQGQGFDAEETLQRLPEQQAPIGRGLPLLMALLHNKLAYTMGGRRATFHLAVRPKHEGILPTRASVREQGRILIITCRPALFTPHQKHLENHGFQQVHIATEALSQMEAMEQYRPHLVILDDSMPDHMSPTLLHELANTRDATIKVMMLGENPTLDDRMQAFHLGAVDYLPLTCAGEELAIRCEQYLINGRTLHQLSRITNRLSADLERARTFQHELLPDAATLTNLSRRHGVDMAVHYQGCDSLAGDYWTVKHLDTNHIGICMVDFTGHGVIAALNTVQLHTLLHGENDLHHPEAVALLLNHHLGRLLSAGSFATYFYGVLNTKTGHLAYCAGGMPPAIVRHAGGTFTSLLTSGLPLAITSTLPVETRHADLRDGDTLLLYSDALTDSPHTDGKRWSTANLLNIMTALPDTSAPNSLISHILDNFYAGVQLPVPDDLTLLALRRAVVCEME